jgi:hypothetical protein
VLELDDSDFSQGIQEDDELTNLSHCGADMQSLQEQLEEIGFKRVYCLTTASTAAWQPTSHD